MVKKVFKFATGEQIPKGAIYLNTVKQEKRHNDISGWAPCWLVWHYFLVDDVGQEKAE